MIKQMHCIYMRGCFIFRGKEKVYLFVFYFWLLEVHRKIGKVNNKVVAMYKTIILGFHWLCAILGNLFGARETSCLAQLIAVSVALPLAIGNNTICLNLAVFITYSYNIQEREPSDTSRTRTLSDRPLELLKLSACPHLVSPSWSVSDEWRRRRGFRGGKHSNSSSCHTIIIHTRYMRRGSILWTPNAKVQLYFGWWWWAIFSWFDL